MIEQVLETWWTTKDKLCVIGGGGEPKLDDHNLIRKDNGIVK
jgi:hypothetical protein